MRHTVERRVEFRDTDAAGIMHFSAFFLKMEEAEHEFLRHLGFSVLSREGGVTLSWPRVSATCEYLRPAYFEDLLTIEISIDRLGEKSVAYRFRFRRGNEDLAVGKVVAVCCEFPSSGHAGTSPAASPRSTPIPQAIAARLSPYVEPPAVA